MASLEHGPGSKVDLPCINRDLPLTFFGVKHSRWTKYKMIEVIKVLGIEAANDSTKIDLYEALHRRYDPQKVPQRTIDALEVMALDAAGQGLKAQTQVRDAARKATLERAELARGKSNAAMRKVTARTQRKQAHMPQLKKPSARPNSVPGRAEEYGGFDNDDDHAVLQKFRRPAPAPRRGKARSKRKADPDMEDNSDVEFNQAVRRVRQRGHPSGLELHRFRQRLGSPPPKKDSTKKGKTDSNSEGEVNPVRPPAVVFGTSSALRNSFAFRVGLEPINYFTLDERCSCLVCSDELDVLLDFQVSVASQCSNAPKICLSCWEQHIASQAKSMTWDLITCPHAGCGVTLNHGDMQRFAPREVYRRYDLFQTHQTLLESADYRLCAHEGCGSGGVVDDEQSKYMTCAACHQKTCLGCNLVHHPGQTCDQYRVWLADAPRRAGEAEKARVDELKHEEEESAQYLRQSAKTCPNVRCGARIQKKSGCNHMVCRACGQQFCWLCLADYEPIRREGNHRHDKSCRYHFGGIPGH